MRYALDFDKTNPFQHMFTLGVDPIEFYQSNLSQIKIDNKGKVSLCYVENLPYVDINTDEVKQSAFMSFKQSN